MTPEITPPIRISGSAGPKLRSLLNTHQRKKASVVAIISAV